MVCLCRNYSDVFSAVCCSYLQVLYLTDVIDEPAVQNLEKYDDKDLIDVTREGLDLGDDPQDKEQVLAPSGPAPLTQHDRVAST